MLSVLLVVAVLPSSGAMPSGMHTAPMVVEPCLEPAHELLADMELDPGDLLVADGEQEKEEEFRFCFLLKSPMTGGVR